MVPSREIYWNIEGHLFLYLFLVISLALFARGMFRRYLVWRLGQPDLRTDQVGMRIKNVLMHTFIHQRLLKDAFPGLMHLLIFWGFVIMFIGTLVVALEADLGIRTMYGSFYLYLSFFVDIFGLLALIGVAIAAWRRYVLKPDRLDNRPDDAWVLVLIGSILISGFLLEGLRISATNDPWTGWQPLGAVLAGVFNGRAVQSLEITHRILWWLHLLLVMVMVAYFPYSKLMHIFTTPLNQFFSSLKAKGVLTAIDFENEELEIYGVEKIEEFTWKQLFDTEACTRCGRCQDHCPAYLTGKPLSPKQMTQNLKDHLSGKAPYLLTQKAFVTQDTGHQEVAAAAPEAPVLEQNLIGDVVTEDEIWACTTCRACQEQCPALVEHIDKTIELRRNLVLMESRFPNEMQSAFRNLENNGNPWGVGYANRGDWAAELGIKTLVEDPEVELLYWPGCAGAYDERNQKVSKALVRILQAAGVSFGILGVKEKCCGDSARRLGNEYLFQMLAQENIETIKGYGVKKIVTQCPHCLHTLKNEYPQFGGEFEIIHHAELIAELLRQGRLNLSTGMDKSIAYHDSCYLGRYNDIYEAPRAVIGSLEGVRLLEMERHHEKSFCCGAGGGRMWLEEKIGENINVARTEQALALQPDLIGTACPFCLTMLGDGLKSKEADAAVQALDLAELIAQAIKEQEPEVRSQVSE